MSLSKKEMMAEIVRCGKDPVYFSNKYARISHPLHGLIPFDMYGFLGTLRNIVLTLSLKLDS